MAEATYFKAPTYTELLGYEVKNKEMFTFGCETDEDCYGAKPGNPMFGNAAVTDAEKALRCCAYIGDATLPPILLAQATKDIGKYRTYIPD